MNLKNLKNNMKTRPMTDQEFREMLIGIQKNLSSGKCNSYYQMTRGFSVTPQGIQAYLDKNI